MSQSQTPVLDKTDEKPAEMTEPIQTTGVGGDQKSAEKSEPIQTTEAGSDQKREPVATEPDEKPAEIQTVVAGGDRRSTEDTEPVQITEAGGGQESAGTTEPNQKGEVAGNQKSAETTESIQTTEAGADQKSEPVAAEPDEKPAATTEPVQATEASGEQENAETTEPIQKAEADGNQEGAAITESVQTTGAGGDQKSEPVATEPESSSAEPTQSIAKPEPRTSESPARFHVPQFSKSTQEILDRMRSNLHRSPSQSSPTLPARFGVTYEDVKRRLVEQLRTSDHLNPSPTPQPSTLAGTSAMPSTLLMPSNASAAQSLSSIRTPTLKRKRADDGPASSTSSLDFHQSTLAMPRLSPRLKRDERAGRDSPVPILNKTQSHAEVERMREERLAMLPEFNKPRLVGFEGGDATFSQRRAYFSQLRDSDLVNLLLFSDAVKDGLLADVLASVSRKHPDLPLFPHPNWDTMGSDEWATLSRGGHAVSEAATATNASPAPTTTSSAPTTTAVPTPKRPPNKKPKTSAIRKVQETEVVERNVVEEEEQLVEEPLPQAWPKPGHGLYAKLPPERDDVTLRDDNDEEAFSGFFVDRMGRQVVEPISG